jgi:hypothetical protein
MNEIAIGVIVSAIVGVVGLLCRQMLRHWRKKRAVEVSVEPVIGDYWAVAFAGEMPDVSEIEGIEYNGRKLYDRLRAHGALDFCETRLRITVRGVSDDTVVVRNIRAEVEHSPPFSGTYVRCPTAGANSATLLVFDLDENAPAGWEWQEQGGRERVGERPFFDLNNVTLARGEVHEFIIIGYARKYLARWRPYLDVETGKHRKSFPLFDSDKPFETSGIPESGFGTTLEWAWYDGARFLPTRQVGGKVKSKKKLMDNPK